MDCVPIPIFCIQCGTDNACRCKIVGPTIGFGVGVLAAIVCWPLSLCCCCCATDAGKRLLATPADMSNAVADAFPC
ncbi:hypothetical protein BDY21DRAFT_284039 [Lineolata rhizophorae]|uniref:Uncharacterized protein n=1 Tax=Lineolata rhizophorae TaxID=578093 RepID=A0A6A6P4G6_9PEZI|nr:hypothetical protein BDY21DRAFT_284039 [Lineolata rhizophorae]